MKNIIPNIDPKTGIHYGIIPVNKLQPWVHDELEPFYPCEHCEKENKLDCEFCEPISWYYKDNELEFELDQQNDIWIFKSPYITYCDECSLCAPNAGYITDQNKKGLKTYALPKEYYLEPDEIKLEKIN